MKKTHQILATIISLIIITFFIGSAQAQVCMGSGYVVDDVDTSGDIAKVSSCTEITGSLYIRYTALTSLTWLENLTSVGGTLDIIDNDALTSLSGLDKLTSVSGHQLRISGNDALTNLNGLESLTSVDGILSIDNNGGLTSLNGLENLTSVSGNVLINENVALTDLCGLNNLSTLPKLMIYTNIALSMATASAFEAQLRSNGFTGDAIIVDNHGTSQVFCSNTDIDNDFIYDDTDNCPNTCNSSQLDGDGDGIGDVCDGTPGCGGGCGQPACEVSCDIDNDGILNTEDNCPDISNSGQADIDSDNVGDLCDNNTVYGNISGAVQNGVNVELYKNSCGGDVLVTTITTNLSGYYAFGSLDNNTYKVVPAIAGYSFDPESINISILQEEIQPYDFTAIVKVCGDGLLNPEEECDDSNTTGGDGCSSNCMVESTGCVKTEVSDIGCDYDVGDVILEGAFTGQWMELEDGWDCLGYWEMTESICESLGWQWYHVDVDDKPLTLTFWYKDGFELIFYTDGSLVYNSNGEPLVTGTYETNGSQISLYDDGCGADPGIYSYVISGNILTLSLISDSCPFRPDVVEGSWWAAGN